MPPTNWLPPVQTWIFLLGYLYFQRKDYAQAQTYLTAATSLGHHNAQALTLLGRTDLQQENYPAARSALEQAVLADDDNWLPHNLLADAYLGQKDYSKARDEAQIAITKGQKDGKTIASPAELVLAQALIGLGQNQEAIQALELFLKDSPQNPMVYQVHNLIADLKKTQLRLRGRSKREAVRCQSIAALIRLEPFPILPSRLRHGGLPTSTTSRPTFVPEVACPAAQVIDESGKRVQELVRDLTRFAADEELFHQSIDAFGFATNTETRKYDYVASVSESEPECCFDRRISC